MILLDTVPYCQRNVTCSVIEGSASKPILIRSIRTYYNLGFYTVTELWLGTLHVNSTLTPGL